MQLDALAQLCARAGWVEEQLFEALGRWVHEVPEPDVKQYFALQSARHGWHADLWRERSPSLAALAPPDGADPAIAAALARAAGGGTVDRLAALCRVVLAELAAAYQDALATTDERLDGPTVRVLTLALRDETDAIAAGEALLARLTG